MGEVWNTKFGKNERALAAMSHHKPDMFGTPSLEMMSSAAQAARCLS